MDCSGDLTLPTSVFFASGVNDDGTPGGGRMGFRRRVPVNTLLGLSQNLVDRGTDRHLVTPFHERGVVRRYPTAPASTMLSSINRFISTAYSIGNSLTIGSMKPATIIDVASSSLRPRLIK